mgnify:CR=1 FL=1
MMQPMQTPEDLALQIYYRELSRGLFASSTPDTIPRVNKLTSEICNHWMKFIEAHRDKNRLVNCVLVKILTYSENEAKEMKTKLQGAIPIKGATVELTVQKDNEEETRMVYYIHLEIINGVWSFVFLEWRPRVLIGSPNYL